MTARTDFPERLRSQRKRRHVHIGDKFERNAQLRVPDNGGPNGRGIGTMAGVTNKAAYHARLFCWAGGWCVWMQGEYRRKRLLRSSSSSSSRACGGP